MILFVRLVILVGRNRSSTQQYSKNTKYIIHTKRFYTKY